MKGNKNMFRNNLKMRKCISGLLIVAFVICGVLSLEPACAYAADSSAGVVAVSLGTNHTAVIKPDGSLWIWGDNTYGQLGNGNNTNSNKPIKVMDEVLANKIAAGEVVEKCMNVVKELVENSIDAKSDEITIKLIDSGVKEIEVIDNGIGMDEEDARLAFQRHATSKLKNLEDEIKTMG